MASPESPFHGDILREPPDFSLVLGGPLYQLLRRAHISGDALELVRRRAIIIALFSWLPLLPLRELVRRAGRERADLLPAEHAARVSGGAVSCAS
jgi:hypothetical protein